MNTVKPEKEMIAEKLIVHIYSDREKLGKAAALATAKTMRDRIQQKGKIRMVFAAAPSQNEFLDSLSVMPDIKWVNVIGFHMDEYLGLPNDAPQRFGHFLRTRLFDRVPFHRVNYIDSNSSDPAKECDRYTSLLQEEPIDIVCMGIGENGHIAFNDPPESDFHDLKKVKVVKLDTQSRQQQVHDGCFGNISQVPELAITLTIPVLLSAQSLFIMVPGKTKAAAVYNTLRGPIHTQCPASILRKHDNAFLFLDADSAVRL